MVEADSANLPAIIATELGRHYMKLLNEGVGCKCGWVEKHQADDAAAFDQHVAAEIVAALGIEEQPPLRLVPESEFGKQKQYRIRALEPAD